MKNVVLNAVWLKLYIGVLATPYSVNASGCSEFQGDYFAVDADKLLYKVTLLLIHFVWFSSLFFTAWVYIFAIIR